MRYIDYGTMQRDAEYRVLEMQRRARNAVYIPERDDSPAPPCTEACSNKEDTAAEVCACADNICGSSCGDICAKETKSAVNDPEALLLLGILVLLIAEKADIVLILAILYLLL